MKKSELILISILAFLLFCTAFFGLEYFFSQKKLADISETLLTNTRIKNFNSIFVEKVLKAREEVSYEDRLALETAAVETNNEQIINQWHGLLESRSEEEAQQKVVELLALFSIN